LFHRLFVSRGNTPNGIATEEVKIAGGVSYASSHWNLGTIDTAVFVDLTIKSASERFADTSSNSIQYTLPGGSILDGVRFRFKKVSANNTMTIRRDPLYPSMTIDGATSIAINVDQADITLVYTGGTWRRVC
jgi:hypothetical protein